MKEVFVTVLAWMRMSELVMAALLGWWASARTPPATTAPPPSWVNTFPTTSMLDAPRPTPLACALASLPIPSAVWPRFTNVLRRKEIPVAAETWTAAGDWFQDVRARSNAAQPWEQLVMALEG